VPGCVPPPDSEPSGGGRGREHCEENCQDIYPDNFNDLFHDIYEPINLPNNNPVYLSLTDWLGSAKLNHRRDFQGSQKSFKIKKSRPPPTSPCGESRSWLKAILGEASFDQPTPPEPSSFVGGDG